MILFGEQVITLSAEFDCADSYGHIHMKRGSLQPQSAGSLYVVWCNLSATLITTPASEAELGPQQ